MSVGSVLLWILAGILAVLLALLVLPVGVRVCYDVSGLRICLLAGPIRWQLLPAKSKWWFKRRTKDKPAPPCQACRKAGGEAEACPQGGSLVQPQAVSAGLPQFAAGPAPPPAGAAAGILGEAGGRRPL
ncbi:MAG: hypothetical protein V8T29_04275 [Oscillospiraceae bacterium]